jgi:hypothetical protein
MNPYLLVTAGLFLLVSALHSILGERFILRVPLTMSWPHPESERFKKRTLRFAWHLTSLTWVGIAAVVMLSPSRPTLDILTLVTLGSGVLTFWVSRGAHLAWPIFLSMATLLQVGAHGPERMQGTLQTVAVATATIALAGIAALHVYWALGGPWGSKAAVPQVRGGAPAFKPGPVLTLAVGLLIGGYAGVLWGVHQQWLPAWAHLVVAAASAVFLLRVVGDFRYFGLFKRPCRTLFARNDTTVYVPLCFGLAWGSLICLL